MRHLDIISKVGSCADILLQGQGQVLSVRSVASVPEIDSQFAQQYESTHGQTSLDHDRLRQSTFRRRVNVRALQESSPGGTTFSPSPASQMCSTMTFGFAMFYSNDRINFDRLSHAASQLATELPQLVGRVKRAPKAGQGGLKSLLTTIPGLRSLDTTSIALGNCGFDLVFAESKQLAINDLGPDQWMNGNYGCSLSSFPVPFYAEPLDIQKMLDGKECLFKLKVTRCKDGDILSATISHMLCDGGRAIRLLSRLSKLYRNCNLAINPFAAGYISEPLSFAPHVETSAGYAKVTNVGEITLKGRHDEPHATDLSVADWLSVPYALDHHQKKKCDVCMVYIPKEGLKRLKSIARGGDRVGPIQSMHQPSTMDAVQAFIAVLVADLRGKTLVPIAPQEFTVNVDLLHRSIAFEESFNPERHLGNAVHILRVPGVSPGTTVPGPLDPSEPKHVQLIKIESAIRHNARLIREALFKFRSDANHAIRALECQEEMVSLPELCVGAAFTVKGNRLKVSSTTSVSAFSFNEIDFGSGKGPKFTQIYCQPRFDWWTIIQNAHGGGIFCTLTLEHGHMQRLQNHPIWSILGPEVRLYLP